MKTALKLSILLTLPILLAGCNSPDSLIEDQIKDMHKLADAMEEDASEEEMEKITDRMEERAEKLDDMDLSDKEKKELVERHKDELEEASGRLMKAMMGKAMEGFGKGMPTMPGFGN